MYHIACTAAAAAAAAAVAAAAAAAAVAPTPVATPTAATTTTITTTIIVQPSTINYQLSKPLTNSIQIHAPGMGRRCELGRSHQA